MRDLVAANVTCPYACCGIVVSPLLLLSCFAWTGLDVVFVFVEVAASVALPVVFFWPSLLSIDCGLLVVGVAARVSLRTSRHGHSVMSLEYVALQMSHFRWIGVVQLA